MKLFDEIPQARPATPLLDAVETPQALRAMSAAQLRQLADELRAYLLYSVGCTGGHFGAGLVILFRVFGFFHARGADHEEDGGNQERADHEADQA